MSKFIEGSKFDGVKYKRWPDSPNSPIDVSMVMCVCGAWWKYHRFSDGACPAKESDNKREAS